MPKNKLHKEVQLFYRSFFEQNNSDRVTDCLLLMGKKSLEAQDDGVENVLNTSMVMDLSPPLTQPSPYRDQHPPASATELSPSNEDLESVSRHNEGSKWTSDQRYDDGCPAIPSVPVCDVQLLPSGQRDDISMIGSLGTFSTERPECKTSDSKSKESPRADRSCAASSPHCELLSHTSQGNGAKDSMLKASDPSNTVISTSSSEQVRSHVEQRPISDQDLPPKKASQHCPTSDQVSPPRKNVPHCASNTMPENNTATPKKVSRARRSIVSTNHNYVSDYRSVDVSIFDKPDDDSTYTEPAPQHHPTTKRKRKRRRPHSRKQASAHTTSNLKEAPQINHVDSVPSPKLAKPPHKISKRPPQRYADKQKSKRQKKKNKERSITDSQLPSTINRDRLNHIKKAVANKRLTLRNNDSSGSSQLEFDVDLFSDDESVDTTEKEIKETKKPEDYPWSGPDKVSKIACALTPQELGKCLLSILSLESLFFILTSKILQHNSNW